ncbi:MAG TPA: WecB/TagA/CpsF family glycosyltransferase [Rhizomicrobium sp.]|nr:WecB/TagA/CpsF family glycosyltransferase [Rhizomicrobium sp.]
MRSRKLIAQDAAAPRRSYQRRDPDRIYSEVVVGGIRTACIGREQMSRLMVGDCLAARGGRRKARLIFASNGHAVSMVRNDEQFRANFSKADLIHADGQPVVIASRLLTDTPIPERSATTDFIHDAAIKARENNLRFFLFGSTEAVNAACAEKLRESYPGLKIVGRRHGYFSQDQEAQIIEEINAAHADVVWVALGVPKEYEFCVRNREKIHAGWLVTAGGCFNFVCGEYRRAPQWMQAVSLEWLYRLWREPRRLWKRYAITNPIAAFTLLTRTMSYRSKD